MRRSPGQHPEEDDALVGGGLCEGAGFRWSLIGALRDGSTSRVFMTVVRKIKAFIVKH